jgi:hypothetical protein
LIYFKRVVGVGKADDVATRCFKAFDDSSALSEPMREFEYFCELPGESCCAIIPIAYDDEFEVPAV